MTSLWQRIVRVLVGSLIAAVFALNAGLGAAEAQAVSPSDAQVLMPSEAAPSIAVCSDDIGPGVNVGVWRFGSSGSSAASSIKHLCDTLVNIGTPNANAEGLALTECDISLGDGQVFLHITVGDDGSRAAAFDACVSLNKQDVPTHLYWGRGNN